MKSSGKVLIMPGIAAIPADCFWWYEPLKNTLSTMGFSCILDTLPDAEWARDDIVIPWMKTICTPDTIAIGHCSGARSILKYLEHYKLKGAILVAPCAHTVKYQPALKSSSSTYWDLVSDSISQDTSTMFNWQAIVENAKIIHQLSTESDTYVPFKIQKHIAEQCKAKLHIGPKEDNHFLNNGHPFLRQTIKKICQYEI